MSDQTPSVADVIREFIVSEVGFDAGPGMTEQATRLAEQVESLIAAREQAAWQRGYDTCESDFGESGDDGDVTTPNPFEGES